MPELPEVETLCGQLKHVVLNTTIQGIEILDPKLEMIYGAVGEKITEVSRRGKALEIHLGNKQKIVLHLRMTGRLLWQTGKEDLPKHARFTIAFSHGRLVCIDPRRFATLNIRDRDAREALINDPFQDSSGNRLREVARNRKIPIKTFLMDQRMIAGIGNIYACEILHAASINPSRGARSLSRKEWKRVTGASQGILSRAIACRGTSISDWRDLSGLTGEYQHELNVYARDGHPCPKCHGTIQRIRLNGRGTYFCPSCQK